MTDSAVFTCNRPTGESWESTTDSTRAREPRITPASPKVVVPW
jgi:hypothetical protein